MAGRAWDRRAEPDRVVLERIVMMLLALAVLVERAAGLPAARRLHLLAALDRSEAEARCLIVAMAAGGCPGSANQIIALSPAAGDAALLAARFRILALMVNFVLERFGAEPTRGHAANSLLPCRTSRRVVPQFTSLPARRATSPPGGWEMDAIAATMIFPRTGPEHTGRQTCSFAH